MRGRALRRGPAEPSVVADRDVLPSVFVLRVVAAYGDTMHGIAEGNREDTRACAVVADGRGRDRPCFAPVFRMEDAGSALPAGAEPGLVIPQYREAGITGGECAFVRQGCRSLPPFPVLPRIGRGKDAHVAVHRVAEHNAATGVPERDRIEEAFRVGVGEEKGPMCAGIVCFVDAGFVAGSGAEENGGSVVKRADAAKIEVGGAIDAAAL